MGSRKRRSGAICAASCPLCTFVIGYIPAAICYLYFAENRQDAAEQLITTSASAIVALLTLTPPAKGAIAGRESKPTSQSVDKAA